MYNYSELSSSFYINLKAQINGDIIDSDDLNDSLRKLHSKMETNFNLRFPVSTMVYQKYRENYFRPNYIQEELLREHIIPVKDLIIQARKKLIWEELSKEELYEWILNTLSLVYKFRKEKEEGWESENLLREEVSEIHRNAIKTYND